MGTICSSSLIIAHIKKKLILLNYTAYFEKFVLEYEPHQKVITLPGMLYFERT